MSLLAQLLGGMDQDGERESRELLEHLGDNIANRVQYAKMSVLERARVEIDAMVAAAFEGGITPDFKGTAEKYARRWAPELVIRGEREDQYLEIVDTMAGMKFSLAWEKMEDGDWQVALSSIEGVDFDLRAELVKMREEEAARKKAVSGMQVKFGLNG